jgi:hypothetical protein
MIHDNGVQAFLTAEVLVHNGFADPGGGRDLLDTGALESAFGEEGPPDLEELLPPLLPGHSSAMASARRAPPLRCA